MTWTGLSGAGKRSDSLKVRWACFASSVSSHSPKMEAKPRENRSRFVRRSRTSKRYLPRFVSSMARAGWPGQGRGSTTSRSRLKRSSVALPVWK